MTLVDPATGWFEITEIPDKTSARISQIFNSTWLVRYPRPRKVIFWQFGQSQPMRQAKLDYNELISGNKLQRKTVSFCRVDKGTVEAAVEFILSPENIVTHLYGVKDVSLSKSETIRLPRLQRTKSRQQIIQKYNEYVYQNSSVGLLKNLHYILCWTWLPQVTWKCFAQLIM